MKIFRKITYSTLCVIIALVAMATHRKLIMVTHSTVIYRRTWNSS